MSDFGFVNPGLQLGLTSILVKPTRKIGDFIAQVTIEETHHDELEITDHPVEQGAIISDHAYKRPAEVVIKCGWGNSPSRAGFLESGAIGAVSATVEGAEALLSGNSVNQVRDIYDKLLKLQESRILFSIYTGKRAYQNMLIKSLSTTSAKDTENSLMVTMTCRQIIVVRTQVVTVPADASKLSNPQSNQSPTNGGIKSLLPGNNYEAGAGRGRINPE